MGAAWLMLAAGDDREHAGNDGYDDLPSAHYSWDNTVANCEKPQIGDVIVLWDKKHLLGASVIDAIEVGEATKQRWRCPSCEQAGLKRRKKKAPAFVCGNDECKAEFADPAAETISVRTFRTKHDAAWVDMQAGLTGAELRALCIQPQSQHSIRSLDYEAFQLAVTANGVSRMTPLESALTTVVGGHRRAVVRVRIGQGAFRKTLLDRHGDVCAFTGKAPRDVLEGAHLYSYAADGRHHDKGGLLMRRDIHRLFDLGHLAVDPDTKRIDVVEPIREYPPYSGLHGRPVAAALDKKHIEWLRLHWRANR